MSNQLDATVAKRLDITVKQNQTFDTNFIFLDSQGEGIDFTGAAAKMSVRQSDCGCNTCAGEDTFDYVLKQDFIPAIGGADMNELEFNDVVKLSEGIYKYDLLVVYANNTHQYLLHGTFKVKRSLTNI